MDEKSKAKALRAARYADFWPLYLGEHRKVWTRRLHFFGTALGLALLIWALATANWWGLLAALISGYAFAWIGHAFIERNKPATFTHPLWSFISDVRMAFLWVTGGLQAELDRQGITEEP